MKTQTNTQPPAAGQAAHTPTPYRVLDGAITCEQVNDCGNFIVVSCDRERTAQDDATLAFIVTACNTYAANQAEIARLREALCVAVSWLEASRALYSGKGLAEHNARIENIRAALAQTPKE